MFFVISFFSFIFFFANFIFSFFPYATSPNISSISILLSSIFLLILVIVFYHAFPIVIVSSVIILSSVIAICVLYQKNYDLFSITEFVIFCANFFYFYSIFSFLSPLVQDSKKIFYITILAIKYIEVNKSFEKNF